MMHGLKQLVYDDQPFFPSNQSEKTNQELYILWKQNKSDNIFLILYTQLWMKLEEIYMENVIDYYKKDCYEKKLFFELVEYQKKFFKENIKIQLLTGYFYTTTEYLFLMNVENGLGVTECNSWVRNAYEPGFQCCPLEHSTEIAVAWKQGQENSALQILLGYMTEKNLSSCKICA